MIEADVADRTVAPKRFQGRVLSFMVLAAVVGALLALLKLSQTFPGFTSDVVTTPHGILFIALSIVLSVGVVYLFRRRLDRPIWIVVTLVLVIALPGLLTADVNLASTIKGEDAPPDASITSIPLNPVRAVYSPIAGFMYDGMIKGVNVARNKEVARVEKAFEGEAGLERLSDEFTKLVQGSSLAANRKKDQATWVEELLANDLPIKRKIRAIGSRVVALFGRDALDRLISQAG